MSILPDIGSCTKVGWRRADGHGPSGRAIVATVDDVVVGAALVVGGLVVEVDGEVPVVAGAIVVVDGVAVSVPPSPQLAATSTHVSRIVASLGCFILCCPPIREPECPAPGVS
jgi:hypothetical protein